MVREMHTLFSLAVALLLTELLVSLCVQFLMWLYCILCLGGLDLAACVSQSAEVAAVVYTQRISTMDSTIGARLAEYTR